MIADRDAGIVDENVDAAMAGGDLVMGRLHGLHIGHVEHDAVDRVSLGGERRRCLLEKRIVHVRQHDFCSSFRQRLDGGVADPACGAGDDGNLVGELELIEIHQSHP